MQEVGARIEWASPIRLDAIAIILTKPSRNNLCGKISRARLDIPVAKMKWFAVVQQPAIVCLVPRKGRVTTWLYLT